MPITLGQRIDYGPCVELLGGITSRRVGMDAVCVITGPSFFTCHLFRAY